MEQNETVMVLKCELPADVECVCISVCKVHRLIIVDELGRVEGVLSLSDILRYLVLRPPAASGNYFLVLF